jgi:predicted transposase YbfD/YdcC
MEHFSKIKDPRVERTKLHQLIEIIIIAICAVISGAEGWEDIAAYGKAKQEWLKKFLDLEHGIPSDDTFRRVFSRIKPAEFEECFNSWITDVKEVSKGEIIPIDGKTLRRSFDRASSKAAIHMVSAWAKTNRLVLGQLKVDEKSNEITAIPKLLDMLEIAGCIVTIDAMGCQKDIATKIIDKEADYVLALKANQGKLYQETELFFRVAEQLKFKEINHKAHHTKEYSHGREEVRSVWSVSVAEPFLAALVNSEQWLNLNSVTMVKSQRTIGDKTTTETRYYISSIKPNAKKIGNAIRSHWSIENSLHWVLDVTFNEDSSRIRKDHAPENFAMLRHIALNLLTKETTAKVGIKAKRKKAGWDDDYLLQILCN